MQSATPFLHLCALMIGWTRTTEMMHVSDIEEALAEGDSRALEAAFRVLVEYPHEDELEGADSPEALLDLLDRVAAALRGNAWAMSPDLAAAILDRTDDVHARVAATYADGARLVSEHRALWNQTFEAAFSVTSKASDSGSQE